MKARMLASRVSFAIACCIGLLAAAGPAAVADEGGPLADETARGPDQARSPNALSPTLNFRMVPGTAFRPTNSDETYSYQAYGCVEPKSIALFDVPVVLPEGSQFNSLRIYWRNQDTTAYTSTVYLVAFTRTATTLGGVAPIHVAVGSVELASVQATRNPGSGYYTRFVETDPAIVDSAQNAYVVRWNVGSATSDQEICGVRVGFYPPLSIFTFMPLVQRN